MGNIIESKDVKNHNIKEFKFGDINGNHDEENTFIPNIFTSKEEQQEDQQGIIEDLKKEILSLKNDVKKLQDEKAEIEKELSDEKGKIENETTALKDESFEQGRIEGLNEAEKNFQNDHENSKTQFINSITSLDEQTIKVKDLFETSEKELRDVAIIIAEKIIKKEISDDSANVAMQIANSFIQTLKDATHITLKVNPKDYYEIKESIKEENIKIEPHDAISRGGVIIFSDAGNIDGNVSTRIEKAIELIKKEG